MNEALHSMVDVLTSDTSRQAFQVTAVALPYLVVALLSAWGLKQVFGVVSFISRGIWRGATVTSKGLYSTAMFVKRQRQKSLEKKIQRYLVTSGAISPTEAVRLEKKFQDTYKGGVPVAIGSCLPKIEAGKPARLIGNSTKAHSPVRDGHIALPGEHIIPIEINELTGRVVFAAASGSRGSVFISEVVPA